MRHRGIYADLARAAGEPHDDLILRHGESQLRSSIEEAQSDLECRCVCIALSGSDHLVLGVHLDEAKYRLRSLLNHLRNIAR